MDMEPCGISSTAQREKLPRCRIEGQLAYNPEHAKIYNDEICKLVDAGNVKELSPQEVAQSSESSNFQFL